MDFFFLYLYLYLPSDCSYGKHILLVCIWTVHRISFWYPQKACQTMKTHCQNVCKATQQCHKLSMHNGSWNDNIHQCECGLCVVAAVVVDVGSIVFFVFASILLSLSFAHSIIKASRQQELIVHTNTHVFYVPFTVFVYMDISVQYIGACDAIRLSYDID